MRYVGCSNFPAWLLCKALWVSDINGWGSIKSVQVQYSLAHRAEYERELMHLCLDQGVGSLAYSPLAEGFLTGKYKPRGNPNRGWRAAHRTETKRFFTRRNFVLLDRMEVISRNRGCSVTQVALAWVMSQPGISSVICGARQRSQLRENLAAVEIELSAQELQSLGSASEWQDDRTPLALPQRTR